MPKLKYNSIASKRTLKRALQRKAQNYFAKLLTDSKSKCEKCGSTENLTIDHKIPLAKGGRSNFENLCILCFKCNNKKGDNL